MALKISFSSSSTDESFGMDVVDDMVAIEYPEEVEKEEEEEVEDTGQAYLLLAVKVYWHIVFSAITKLIIKKAINITNVK